MTDAPVKPGGLPSSLRHWDPQDRWYKPAVSAAVILLSRFTMQVMNRIRFEDRHHWDEAFGNRPRGLLSFSNHVSLFDDPFLISCLGELHYRNIRWIPADHINFFGNAAKGWLFSCGKCIPIIRGGGLDQPGFAFLRERLLDGDWVHIFPEGGRTRDRTEGLKLPFKSGIGRLMVEARPKVLPFVHRGMSQVLPIGARLPRSGHEVRVRFGQATQVSTEWVDRMTEQTSDLRESWRLATTWAERELQELQRSMHQSSQGEAP